MMKIAIVSDTHGLWQPVYQALWEESLDYLFFLGDTADDGRKLADALAIPATVLKGNCDYTDIAPAETKLTLAGVDFLLCHGDNYNVKEGLDWLCACAQRRRVEVVCFGHSHIPVYETGEVLLINPGSASKPRNYGDAPSWGLLTIEEEQGADGKKVKKYVKKCLPML